MNRKFFFVRVEKKFFKKTKAGRCVFALPALNIKHEEKKAIRKQIF